MLLLLNVRATVFPAKAPSKDFGTDPDLKACLCECAFRTSVVSSVIERSAMLRRCLGAKGEVDGEEEL